MKYYLAYGSNLNLVQMFRRCPYARVIGHTSLPGMRLVFYQKQTLHVPEVMAVGTKDVVLRDIDAMIYTMPTDHRLGLPSTYYWKVCKQGYRDFHFALRHLEKALFDSRAGME